MAKDTIRTRRHRARTEEEFIEGAKADREPVKKPGKAGRPAKHTEATRLKAFNLPLSLIRRIEEEAEERTAGNASALIMRILEEYFSKKK